MLILKTIFFFGLFILFYSYFGYAILIWLIKKITPRRKKINDSDFEPEVTLVIAAYNEELFIRKKIENTLRIDYSPEKIKFVFITDGSTDNTEKIIKEYPAIKGMHENTRKGKVAAIERAMYEVKSPIVIFSDANTFINKDAVKNIVRHYIDPRVGGVAGEKKILIEMNEDIAGTGEGIYWKYESVLKKLDSNFYSVVGAAGELFSIRTALYEHPGDDILLDDFIISLKICMQGFRIVYEPDAYAIENPSGSIKEEKKRKIRISAGAFQSIVKLKGLLNIFKFKKLSFLFISHRVLRWTLCPLFIPLVLITNCWLFFSTDDPFYLYFLHLQLVFYSLALAGWIFSNNKIHFKPAYICFYFMFINIVLYIGFFRFLKKQQSVLWEKAERK